MALVAAALLLAPGTASAQATGGAPDMKALAGALAETPKPDCPQKLPDGTCPDEVSTRQLVLPGAAGASPGAARPAARAPVRAVRQNISMTFLLGSAELTEAAKARLDQLAAELAKVRTYRAFTVEGHTDRTGSRETNLALSQARARSVVDYLASRGVDRAKMTARGFGFDRLLPGVSATSPAQRRVEVSAR